MIDQVLPLPPIELRRSVGLEDAAAFENPSGAPIFGEAVALRHYDRIFDFGCGCGRTARQLLQQSSARPTRYLGVDVNKAAVDWCRANLSPVAPSFAFAHLNAWSAMFNPGAKSEQAPFPTSERFSLVHAHSVFTHIVERNLAFYFNECARLVEDGGLFRATWFLFDKGDFPMMQDFQNCLYINDTDPTNAAVYDIELVKSLYRNAGLRISRIAPPHVRGFQWVVDAVREAGEPVEFPADAAPRGLVRPPTSLRG